MLNAAVSSPTPEAFDSAPSNHLPTAPYLQLGKLERLRLRVAPATLTRRIFDRAVHGVAWLAHQTIPFLDPAKHGVRLIENIAYRETRARHHLLDVYRPHGAGLHPAVLYVHGGAFSMLSKDTHRLMALQLASKGYTVFNINYRLGPRYLYPAQIEDASLALAWLVDNAEKFGGDPNRIVLAGESAGGNLVASLAYLATRPRPEWFAREVFKREPKIRGVLSIYGIHDLHDVARFWRAPEKARKMSLWVKRELRDVPLSYLGSCAESAAMCAPLASPLRRFSEPAHASARPLPPFFATVGTRDPLLDDSRRLREALEKCGGSCELHVFPGEIHGFNAMLWRRHARLKWRLLHQFLQRHTA